MPRKYVCNLSKEELYNAYVVEGRTLEEMCSVLGVKSPITVGKVLRSFEIDTYKNGLKKKQTMHGMDEDEFRNYLIREYQSGNSMPVIAEKLGVTPSCIRKYFVKYSIMQRHENSFYSKGEKSCRWKGGRRSREGYISVYCPDHPYAAADNSVYEHRLVVEKEIGRYLTKDEFVHHINGIKDDNRIENLVILTNSEHARLHAILKRGRKRITKGE